MPILNTIEDVMETFADYADVPVHIRMPMARYIINGDNGGDFVTSVFENNLTKAIFYADSECNKSIRDICSWVHNVAPVDCWGSREDVARYQRIRRKRNK